MRISKILLLTSLILLSGCGNEIPSALSETAEETTAAEYIQVTASPENGSEHRINVKSYNENFDRCNKYSGDIEYSFRIKEMKLSCDSSPSGCGITLRCTGEKTYDAGGRDTARPLKLSIKLTDSDGYTVAASDLYSSRYLRQGEAFTDLCFSDNMILGYGDQPESTEESYTCFFPAEPGTYTLELIGEKKPPVRALPSSESFDFTAERYYCPSVTVLTSGTDTFDTSAEWTDTIAKRDVHVTADNKLTGLFDDDYDLSKLNFEESNNGECIVSFDEIYKPIKYYDINDPEKYLSGIPDDAMPQSVRIGVEEHGSILHGERAGVSVSFRYPEENGYTLVFSYYPGNTLTSEEWEKVRELFE